MSNFAPFYALKRTNGTIYPTIETDRVVIGDQNITINGEMLRVLGGIRADTAGYIELANGSSVPASTPGSARIRYNEVSGGLEMSIIIFWDSGRHCIYDISR
jgi:hypothetical protein